MSAWGWVGTFQSQQAFLCFFNHRQHSGSVGFAFADSTSSRWKYWKNKLCLCWARTHSFPTIIPWATGYRNYLASICTVLGIISNLQMIWKMYRSLCLCSMQMLCHWLEEICPTIPKLWLCFRKGKQYQCSSTVLIPQRFLFAFIFILVDLLTYWCFRHKELVEFRVVGNLNFTDITTTQKAFRIHGAVCFWYGECWSRLAELTVL